VVRRALEALLGVVVLRREVRGHTFIMVRRAPRDPAR
jgi:hypothetical protein